jgi:hypothetical protein
LIGDGWLDGLASWLAGNCFSYIFFELRCVVFLSFFLQLGWGRLLAGWAGWLVGWLVGLAGCLDGWLAGWLARCSAGWLAGWLAGGWLFGLLRFLLFFICVFNI